MSTFINSFRFYGGAANTFIGGVSSVINTPALLAAKLQNYPSGTAFDVSKIFGFTIVGSDIECYIGVNYQIKQNSFQNTIFTASSPTYYKDDGGKCKRLMAAAFYTSLNTTIFNFPEVVDINGGHVFYHANYSAGSGLLPITKLYLPKCTILGNNVNLNENQFGFTSRPTELSINDFLRTANAGSPDQDLVVGATLGVNITYII